MKKILLASLITSTSFVATADVLTFDDSSFTGTPGSNVVFDFIDYDSDVAQVTQTDTGNNSIYGPADDFSELGSTDVVNFKLGGATLGVDPAYEVFFQYSFSGMVTTVVNDEIVVNFDSSTPTGLYVDTNVNGTFDGGTQIADFTLRSGVCEVSIAPGAGQNKGFCALDLNVDFLAGYFFNSNGDDLSTTPGAKTAELIVTVQDVIGLSADYGGAGNSQTFQIAHDGNMRMSVPEPATIAILGLGLLGFAGMSRRNS